MRILVISDIHANKDALNAVIKDAKNFDGVWCLGDIVGYGPEPNECIEIVRNLPELKCIKGNHDVAAIGEMDISLFNQEAKDSMMMHQSILTKDRKKFLHNLPEKIEVEGVTLVHGSPRNPIWEYILEPYIARINYEFFKTEICMIGHSHQPLISSWNAEDGVLEWGAAQPSKTINIHNRMIINPGSVGQPRDYDPRAAYGIFHTSIRRFEFKRVEYDIAAVQKKIIDKKMPSRHAERLSAGW